MSDEQKEKANARSYAKVYMERGKITKQPCVVSFGYAAHATHNFICGLSRKWGAFLQNSFGILRIGRKSPKNYHNLASWEPEDQPCMTRR